MKRVIASVFLVMSVASCLVCMIGGVVDAFNPPYLQLIPLFLAIVFVCIASKTMFPHGKKPVK